jgi:hypothetical protein
MGVDFLSKAAKSYTKSWDRGRKELDTSLLFNEEPELRRRCYSAIAQNGHRFVLGNVLVAICDGKALRIFEGSEQIGSFVEPPEYLIDEIMSKGCGLAVATVENVAELSGIADVSVK